MRAMSAFQGTRSRRVQPAPSDYTQLLRLIQEQGLLRRRYAFYAVNLVTVVAAFGVVWIVFFAVGNSWMQLFVAAAFGVVLAQVGFLGHDAAHRQVFRSGPRNDLLASLLGGLLSWRTAWAVLSDGRPVRLGWPGQPPRKHPRPIHTKLDG